MEHEERRRRIAEAAYYRAERRGFRSEGNEGELEDWLAAEREFEDLLTPFPDAMPSEGGADADPAASGAEESAERNPTASPQRAQHSRPETRR